MLAKNLLNLQNQSRTQVEEWKCDFAKLCAHLPIEKLEEFGIEFVKQIKLGSSGNSWNTIIKILDFGTIFL